MKTDSPLAGKAFRTLYPQLTHPPPPPPPPLKQGLESAMYFLTIGSIFRLDFDWRSLEVKETNCAISLPTYTLICIV